MEVKTVHGIMDIHKGARYAEVYLPISPLGLVFIWEVISQPEVKEESDDSRLISWMARNTRTGEETMMGINDRDIHYSYRIYPIDHPKIKKYLESLS